MRVVVALSLVLSACTARADSPCRAEHVDGVAYTICSFAPTDSFRLFHSNADGEIYGDFDTLNADLAGQGAILLFAMNAGMYHRDRAPVGLYVENGMERSPLSTSEGPGNFHMRPNGVLAIARDGRVSVVDTRDYPAVADTVSHATQSGPMLVINGKLHPRFLADGTSRKIRNGVGVDADGRVHFAKSEDPVNFHGFATLFRDHLDTDNALYLDGTISRLFIAGERNDPGAPMGPIVGVVE